MLDYKGDKEYPKERLKVADFPSKEELFVYGDDYPMPESLDDLKCEYREKEGTPPLKLEELRGYCVPPDGIIYVTVNGMGMKAGTPIVYGVNTFRENRHGLGMELGISHKDAIIKREQSRRDAETRGYIKRLEEEGIATLDNTKAMDVQTLEALAYFALDFIMKKEDGREMRQLYNDFHKRQAHTGSVTEKLRDKPASGTMKDAVDFLKAQNEAKRLEIELAKTQVVEAEFIDEGDKAE